jgi:hypothetical protein
MESHEFSLEIITNMLAEVMTSNRYEWVDSVYSYIAHHDTSRVLLDLRDHIDVLPLKWLDGEECDQYRVIGVGFLAALMVRPIIPNWVIVGAWVSSTVEPLGYFSNCPVRDLAIKEVIRGPHLRDVLTKTSIGYLTTLKLLIQLAAALFVAWQQGLYSGALNMTKIRILPNQAAVIDYRGYHVDAPHIVFLTDYTQASCQYRGNYYYHPTNKCHLGSLLYHLATLTTGQVYQAIEQVYQYASTTEHFTDDWLDNLMSQPWARQVLTDQPVTPIYQPKWTAVNHRNNASIVDKRLLDVKTLLTLKDKQEFLDLLLEIRIDMITLQTLPDKEPFYRLQNYVNNHSEEIRMRYLILYFDQYESPQERLCKILKKTMIRVM